MVTGDPTDPIAQIVDLRSARLERLAAVLAPALEEGQVIAETATLPSVSDWRAAARRISRERRWHIRTGVTADGSRVWAVRLDREFTAEDREVLRRRLDYLGAVLSPKQGLRANSAPASATAPSRRELPAPPPMPSVQPSDPAPSRTSRL